MNTLRDQLDRIVRDEGFAAHGVCAPDAARKAAPRLQEWLEKGEHGTMAWMESRSAQRSNPRQLWPEVKSVLVVADTYDSPPSPDGKTAQVAAYAQQRDYHDTVKRRLKRVASWLAETAQVEVKVFVDTAPVMEKPLAEAAGLGWQGKHTNLVSRDLGSWFVLGVIFTTAELPVDAPHDDRCGSCRRCLDICPTAAFAAPYRLDARRCISYLTIELKDPIPRAMRPLIGERVFGCDDCLAVCPWNRFASDAAANNALIPALDLISLVRLSDSEFRELFRGTPLRRTGRNRFVRNVLIALGNRCDPSAISEVDQLLDDDSSLVRGAAIWSLSRLCDIDGYRERMNLFTKKESDPYVMEEWKLGMEDVERRCSRTP